MPVAGDLNSTTFRRCYSCSTVVLPFCLSRKIAHLGERSFAARAASGGGADVESGVETRIELVHFDGHLGFTVEDIMAASMGVLGRGDYGTTHCATLVDGNQVAVRRLTRADITREFEAGVNMLGRIRHPNLLPLRAYYHCPEGENKFLVFDHMPKGSLSALVYGRLRYVTWKDGSNELAPGPCYPIDWLTRLNIAIGITRGMHYLHTEENMVHGSLTSGNVLLDDHNNARIADYGLYKLLSTTANSNLMETAWTYGYRAPELSKLNRPNTKTDVYNLGVIMLELLTGMSPRSSIKGLHLPEWVAWFAKRQWTDKVFDKDLVCHSERMMGIELLDTLTLALCCVDPSPDARPEIWQVLQKLEKIKPTFAMDTVVTTVTKGGDKSINGGGGGAMVGRQQWSPEHRLQMLDISGAAIGGGFLLLSAFLFLFAQINLHSGTLHDQVQEGHSWAFSLLFRRVIPVLLLNPTNTKSINRKHRSTLSPVSTPFSKCFPLSNAADVSGSKPQPKHILQCYLLIFLILPCCLNRNSAHPSQNSSAASAAIRDEKLGTTGGTEVESSRETRIKLVHFGGHLVFTPEHLLSASTVILEKDTCGTVYLAMLEDGSRMFIRRLTWVDNTREFKAELNMLAKIRHPNLLALRAYYYCLEGKKLFLVFDHMRMESLSDHLHGPLQMHMLVTWQTRLNVAIQITRGLHYLHTQRNMVHGNLTSGNVLLDDHGNAKIMNSGLSHLITASNSNMTATTGDCAPELFKSKKANTRSDVYSLGVIMLELLTGKSPRMKIDSLNLREWVTGIVEQQGTYKVFDPDLMWGIFLTEAIKNLLHETLNLALHCIDPLPDARPEVWQVLRQLEEIKKRFMGDTGATTVMLRDKPIDGGAHAGGTKTTAAPSRGTTTCPLEDSGLGTPETPNVLANDGNPQARLQLAINSLKDEIKKLARLPSKGDLEEGDRVSIPIPKEETIEGHSGNEDSFVTLSAQLEGCDGASFAISNMNEEATEEDKTGENMSSERTDTTSRQEVANQVISTTWAEISIEAQLQVPTSPPLISSDPDAGYQRYFRTLYDLAYRSPPLQSTALEVQLNRMIMGLHSLGYPLGTWLKAATAVLDLAKRRECIEHHVDEYFKVHVETQLEECASAVALIQEEASRIHDISTHEQEQRELDEIISKLEAKLAVLKTQREGVVDSLTTSRHQFAVAEAKLRSLFVDMERLNQQSSVISDLRCNLLQELPSLDEAFDDSFLETLIKKF